MMDGSGDGEEARGVSGSLLPPPLLFNLVAVPRRVRS